MNAGKVHIRRCTLRYFYRGKTGAEATRIISKTYGDNIVSGRTRQDWFKRFESCDFDMNDKSRSGRPQTIRAEI
ncbi:Histone-lysine N-methyltransferase SETMAR [Habropoda laboriosa]|uniref:Histone-lysine N-methyltransferase SETMAR n=1 Tax=Habropoda laboriosa TaxID=597456 RepID=A0A0L7QP78_9HYME|nr:Histone-lysine N-methyltransferase SETMAR [Habropoda laboriosa]